MHSRTYLHRISDQPRASAGPDGGGRSYPLGFADVRSGAEPSVEATRRPLGFAPPAPSFVTELSFRRAAPAPAAEVPGHTGSGDLGVGHASAWRRRDDAPAEETPEPEAPQPVAEEKVPFYKREISLRRRKDADVEPAVAAVEKAAEAVDEEGATGPAAVETEPSRAPIGFAPADPPAGDAVTTEPVDDVPAEVEPAEEAVAEASAETLDASRHGAPAADEPVAASTEAETAVGAPDVPPAADATEAPEGPEAPAAAGGETEHETPAPVTELEGARKQRGRGAKSASRRASGGRGGSRVVGLKIGASQLAAAVVSSTDGRHELLQLARTPLEPGLVADGEVRDPEALSVALARFFADHKLPRKNVRVGIASNRIGVRTLDIVGIDDQERFDNAVRFKAHEVLPVSVHESVLDYRVVEEKVTETGDLNRRVLLVVAPRDQVQPYVEVCTGAGLRLGGIDLEALGLMRAFVEPQPVSLRTTTDTATVVVAIGHELTSLLVAGGGACEFTRVFDWGGATLQQSIAQELDLTTAEASGILHGLSLSGAGRGGVPEEQRARALDAVRTRLTPFARELVSSLQFYQSQQGSLGIGEIVITGGTSHLEGLADALHQMIGVNVRVGDPLARVISAGPIDSEIEATLGSMAVPIGLAIDDEALRSVNLLPSDVRAGQRKRPGLLAVAAPIAAVIPIAAMGVLLMQARGDVSDRQAELSGVQAQIAALPEPTRPTIDPAIVGVQAERATALAGVLGTRVAWEGVLRDLARVLPADISLTRMAARVPVAAATPAAAGTPTPAPTTPQAVEISGYTFDHPGVARLLSRLQVLPSLTNVQLQSASREKIGKKPVVKFTVLADLSQPGGVG